jgi:hypothetical protein
LREAWREEGEDGKRAGVGSDESETDEGDDRGEEKENKDVDGEREAVCSDRTEEGLDGAA